jgi:uncharacterized protein with HEPN domain
MDEDRVLKWLFDVYGSIEEIESFLPETKRSVQLLEDNVMFKRALERNIEVIGEAINRVLTAEPEIAISHARRIVDTRNFIIHEYEKVSDEVLWAIAVRHIPLLKAEIEKLIAERGA